MRINKLDIIIPTWNSMPEIENTLESLVPALGDKIGRIIIVDKFSNDATVNTVINWGVENDISIHLIHTEASLGTARKMGLLESNTKYVLWVDSDIVLPVNWLKEVQKYWTNDTGWVYGITCEDIPFIEKTHQWKRELKNNLPRTLHKGEFERAYTNNSVTLRKPLLDAPIDGLNAWEDYVMGQHMIEKGYKVIEVPIFCDHLKHGVYKKFGNYTEAWGIAGELKAKGWNMYTLMRPFYFLYWGVRCTLHFKDFRYTQYYIGVFISMWKAIYNRTKAIEWSRN